MITVQSLTMMGTAYPVPVFWARAPRMRVVVTKRKPTKAVVRDG